MKILITGATGLVGSKLIETLFLKGFSDISILTRSPDKAVENSPFPIKAFHWDPYKGIIDKESVHQADIIIHLAGENIGQSRWTNNRKEEILQSRKQSTELLVSTINQSPKLNIKLISASAIGIYEKKGSFLNSVCEEWERPLLKLNPEKIKTHIVRIGLVLAENGGALEKMLTPFELNLGGKLGDGKQMISWIHIEDLVGQIIFLIKKNCQNRIYNCVSPTPVTNKEFTKALGFSLNKITPFPIPATILKIGLGEMSSLLLSGKSVFPNQFLKDGYQFKFTKIHNALEDLLSHRKMGERKLVEYQWINKDLKNVFRFFSDEKNLEKITPNYLNFKVVSKSSNSISIGTIIKYKLKLHGLPLTWKSKISDYNENNYFIDEQLSGPYKKWIHRHEFKELYNGTLIKDHVTYKVPFGFFGKILEKFFISKDLKNIFNYRKLAISRDLKTL